MIYYLYGPDSYRRNAKLRELVAAYKKKYASADLFEFDFSEREDVWRDVKDYVSQPSMFVETKVAVIFHGGQMNEKGWVEVLRSELKTKKTFLLISDAAPPPKALRFLLKAPATSKEYAPLSGAALEAFVKKEANRAGILLAPDARRALCRFAERRKEDAAWEVFQNIAKLALAGSSQPITKVVVEKVLDESEREQVRSLTHSILSARDPGSRLVLLEKIFLQNEASAYAFNSMSFQSRGRDVLALADYDILVKSGKLEYDEALLDFVLQ